MRGDCCSGTATDLVSPWWLRPLLFPYRCTFGRRVGRSPSLRAGQGFALRALRALSRVCLRTFGCGYTYFFCAATGGFCRVQEPGWHRQAHPCAHYTPDLNPGYVGGGHSPSSGRGVTRASLGQCVGGGRSKGIASEAAGMEPWRCQRCKLQCKATAEFCSKCGGRWTETMDKSWQRATGSGSTAYWEPGAKVPWKDGGQPWKQDAWRHPSQSPRRRREKGKGQQGPKGKSQSGNGAQTGQGGASRRTRLRCRMAGGGSVRHPGCTLGTKGASSGCRTIRRDSSSTRWFNP